MKPLRFLAVSLVLAMAGCAATGMPGSADAADPFPSATPADAGVARPPGAPRLVIDPASGTPVQAIDIGGGLFQPLTGGGGPIPGIPVD